MDYVYDGTVGCWSYLNVRLPFSGVIVFNFKPSGSVFRYVFPTVWQLMVNYSTSLQHVYHLLEYMRVLFVEFSVV